MVPEIVGTAHAGKSRTVSVIPGGRTEAHDIHITRYTHTAAKGLAGFRRNLHIRLKTDLLGAYTERACHRHAGESRNLAARRYAADVHNIKTGHVQRGRGDMIA